MEHGIYDYKEMNWDEVAEAIGIKPKRMPMLVEAFLEESHGNLKKLHNAIEVQNFPEIMLHAHSLKGSCGNMKLTELYEISKEMEKSAKDQNAGFDYKNALEVLEKSIETVKAPA